MTTRQSGWPGNPTLREMSADVVATGILVLALPMFIVSQWLAIRWGLPTRQIFNGLAVVSLGIVLTLGVNNLAPYKRELWITAGFGLTILLSIAVNGVPISVATRGSLPYFGAVIALLAGLAARPSDQSLRIGATVGGWSAAGMALLAIPQLILGEPAYRSFGQDLPYPRWWERGRATGLVANPGRLSQIGLIALALSPRIPIGAVWVTAGAAVAVAAGGARLAIVAAVVLLAIALAFRKQPRANLIWMGALGAVLLFGLIQAVLPAARNDLVDRTETVLDELQDDDGHPDDIRVANLRASLEVWSEFPILGTGPGRFGSTTAWATGSPLHDEFGLPDVRSKEYVSELRERGDEREIDVGTAQLDLGWFQVLAELGSLGVLGVVALIGSVATRGIRARDVVPLALLATLVVVSLGAPGLVDLSLASVAFFWVGAMMSSSLRSKPSESR